tara:strand:- start:67 stop:537 length:471 start_codon:yes stop_codon:yes gene_type:complete
MEYGWKDGSRIKLDPQIAGEYLDSLSISGPGDAREIVDAGRPTSSPIHSYFEWDNEIAGEEYRVIQGRKLGGSLVEIKRDDNGNSVPVRRYFTVYRSSDTLKEYVKREIVLNDEEKYLQLLEQAIRELKGMQRRYHTVVELNDIWDIAEVIQKKLG